MRKSRVSLLLGVLCAMVCGLSFAGDFHRVEVPKWESAQSVNGHATVQPLMAMHVAPEAERMRRENTFPLAMKSAVKPAVNTTLSSGLLAVGKRFAPLEVGAGCCSVGKALS